MVVEGFDTPYTGLTQGVFELNISGFAWTKHDEEMTMSQKSAANQLEGRVKTLNEVASLLRISRGSAYEAAKRKEIPTIRIGRRLLVPSDALERLLSGKTADEAERSPSPGDAHVGRSHIPPAPRGTRARRRINQM